ncbi:hypothetical protein MNEG_7489 [Monoraphidium neglectum]|uniref:Glycoside hydrolase family 5 domain-containing protein n=1 Tax=Monoraphidium neglectum TaxID=145388 RepID=A0A0D2JMR6_9CHLO|nr:hypothetical protein MNEG_7489 [Monoraphidium neglectum]KIZ00473.1 hypothetical protein MNEG_7489 [Monoraphidium neglectum]|eukprot:XP_013899492.1 hypothetical protein MNEG_7489 [Monoraphidium neglectum]
MALSRVLMLLGVLAWSSGTMAANATFKCTIKITYAQPPRGQSPDAVKFQDDAIVRTKDGRPVQIKSVSWWGVNDNGTSVLGSLWSGGSAAATDMPSIAFQLRAQGLNGIRLPFTFEDLRAPPRSMWAKQGCQKVTLGVPSPPGDAPAAPAAPGGARCAWYLPDSSSQDRLLWTLQWFVANGFYVLLEHTPAGSDAISRNAAEFSSAWRSLWRAVACLPNFEDDLQGRVFVGLLGAPDITGHRWEASRGLDGGELPGITELYLDTMDALWEDTPAALTFFIAGAGQGGASTWGSGFVTDKAIVAVNDYSGALRQPSFDPSTQTAGA